MAVSPVGNDPPARAATGARTGIYRPRRPEASPLYRLVQDHFAELVASYEERFAHRYGPWRPVVRAVVEKFLDCGLLEPGFARVRCGECGAEFLVAFSCKYRYFCPSCHAKRLALWCDWLEMELLLPIPHRQYVFTIPKRLRPYFLYDRRLLGLLSRVAYDTLRDFMRATLGADDVVPGVISSIQTHGTLANWHPHLHVLATDGAFRPDGTFVPLGAHSLVVLTEAFRRATLGAFVQRGLFSPDVAASMLAWPHSGFHVHNAVRLAGEDLRGTLQLARYAARAPLALARITYDATKQQVVVASDKAEGPTAGTHAFDPLDFLAELLTHIPRRGEHLVRYYGAYASRTRGTWRQQGIGPWVERRRGEGDAEEGSGGPAPDPDAEPAHHDHAPLAEPPSPSPAALRKRWAELLRRIYEVDPLSCPRCGGEMRIIAFILDPPVIDAILRHLRRASVDARAGPWAEVAGRNAVAGDAGPGGVGLARPAAARGRWGAADDDRLREGRGAPCADRVSVRGAASRAAAAATPHQHCAVTRRRRSRHAADDSRSVARAAWLPVLPSSRAVDERKFLSLCRSARISSCIEARERRPAPRKAKRAAKIGVMRRAIHPGLRGGREAYHEATAAVAGRRSGRAQEGGEAEWSYT